VTTQLEDAKKPLVQLDPKEMQINLTPVLEKNAAVFMKELWEMLLDAQEKVGGVPSILIQQKRDEIMKRKVRHAHRPFGALADE
jgi:hypothetical protein